MENVFDEVPVPMVLLTSKAPPETTKGTIVLLQPSDDEGDMLIVEGFGFTLECGN